MPAGDFPVLVGAVSGGGGGLAPNGVKADPWAERDRLASGSPVQITGLARAFARAGRDAGLATELGKQASRLTAEGYRVDGTPVHQIRDHVNRTKKLLGDAGGNMVRIARILDGIADELASRTGTANRDIAELESQLGTLQRAWDDYHARYESVMATGPTNAADLATQYVSEQTKIRDRALALVNQYGSRIAGSVADYDGQLGRRVRDLADMGYYPPDALAEGPGDVGADPDAGGRDGQKLADALDLPPGKQSLAEIDAASSDVRILNDKVANDGRLTDAERDYLTDFYNALGADDLARLPAHIREAAPAAADPRRGADGYPMSTADDVYTRTLRPFGDSLMNLSNGKTDNGLDVRYESLPAPLRTLIDDTHLGLTYPNLPGRFPNERFHSGPENRAPDPMNPTGWMTAGGVAGMDRYRGLADLVSSSTIAPGKATAEHLADAAIRGKQELNAMHDQARWSSAVLDSFATDEQLRGLDRMIDDSASSDLLSAAARNNEASSGLLTDDTRRAQILGLNWEDGTGAADVVHAGTQRDPREGGGTEAQAKAALAVVREVGGDRDGYLDRMSDPVKAAVRDVGVQYVDSFAREDGSVSEYRSDLKDALGRNVGPSFQLTDRDRDLYLQFVAGTGQQGAEEFQAKATIVSQTALADAFANGNAEQVTAALRAAGRLDGAITQANYDYVFDTTDEEDKAVRAAYRAEQIQNRAIATAATVGAVLVTGGVAVATAGTGSVLISPAVAVATSIASGGVGMATMDNPLPAPQLPQTKEDLFRADAGEAPIQRDVLIASAMRDAGVYGDTAPPRILSYDADGNGSVGTPHDLGRDAQQREELRPGVVAGLNRWEAAHGGDVDLGEYDDARRSTLSNTWDGSGAPTSSAWRDEERADVYAYGRPLVPDHPFPNRPSNPEVLDDPNYDRISNRMRN